MTTSSLAFTVLPRPLAHTGWAHAAYRTVRSVVLDPAARHRVSTDSVDCLKPCLKEGETEASCSMQGIAFLSRNLGKLVCDSTQRSEEFLFGFVYTLLFPT